MVTQSVPTSYEPVKHKKSTGKLALTADGMVFATTDAATAAAAAAGNENNDQNSTYEGGGPGAGVVNIPWSLVSKHQVSPATHPKSMLKVVLVEGSGKPLTFQLDSRPELERIRKDISDRLQGHRSQHSSLLSSPSQQPSTPSTASGTKRRHPDSASTTNTPKSASSTAAMNLGRTTSSSFGELDPAAMAVVRSSLLAANSTLRDQHQYLVQDSQTLNEEDFWKTHEGLLEEEYARIAGLTRAGTSSLLRSHLQVSTGKVTLGVEEMRQIFIMYPAVHRAYEEKVPLELSDEQFWRKYLESEYFHRDRGKIGAASHRSNNQSGGNGASGGRNNDKNESQAAAAMGTDDMFSRYDQKMRDSGQIIDGGTMDDAIGGGGGGTSLVASSHGGANGRGATTGRKWGTNLAVGQFDLASTFATERGDLLEGPKDNHPPDADEDTKGQKVIQKYNRHWAMVLNPEEAVAGSNLVDVARKSVKDTIPDDEDAKAGGGLDEEMQRLVGFANSSSENANHAMGIGESDEYQILTLKNIEAYSGSSSSTKAGANPGKKEADALKLNRTLATRFAAKIKDLVKTVSSGDGTPQKRATLKNALPPAEVGKQLLQQLTKRMDLDSKTDADTLEIVNALPDDFKRKLLSYFRRSSELLRHFFGLRRLLEGASQARDKSAYETKLEKILKGMRTVFQEVDDMRKKVEGTGKDGVTMRQMCLQIQDQLDWAFKLHREGAGSSGGGFQPVQNGFEVVEILLDD